ncbi:MAG: Uncharacterized protein XD87_0276 [candidate division WS6 bacterium 36_33]|uniref:Sporulation stage II protein D amidase enhancer LytB N-terminal domain-containing protein n=1 Tax=candidate division WS6 bacterium 36_33 TaxID=1641388 RepID=A0A117LTY0_9BACT|nr:MAG: Uncharacterized protein XD87_0276 [candidate division WS6 bacterium 36_33]
MSKLSKIVLNILIISFFGIFTFSLFNHPVYSNTVEELEEQIAEKEKEIEEKKSVLESVEARIAEISNSNYSVSQKINLLTEEITSLEESIKETEREIDEKVKGIEEKQEQLATMRELIDEVSGDLYMQSRYKLANFFLNKDNWSNIVETLFIKQSTISMLRREAEKIGGEFSSLAESKAELDKEKKDLDKERASLDEAYRLLADERAKLQAELSREVAAKNNIKIQIGGISKEISQLQQTLILVRGGINLSTLNIPSSNADPTSQLEYFLSNAPSGSFGIFSFGASTHRNGMSQWGAWERAQQGQSYEDILNFYYSNYGASIRTDGKVRTSSYGEEQITSTIQVDGGNPISFEDDYMLGIREIDPLFNKDNEKDLNNLKAQAIAARTFALNYTNNGRKSICSTQSCQVYSTSRFDGAWAKAVSETKGMTLKNSSGNVFSAQYSSVTGGWINNVGYDVKAGSSSWAERAYEGLSGVSWFHKIWYQMSDSDGNKYSCSSHPNPWLTGEELADILNAYKYLTDPNSPSSDPRLLSPDYNTCFGGGGYPYSPEELRSLVPNAATKVLGVDFTESNGWTTSISFAVRRVDGSVSTEVISGKDNILAFRDAFNIRAPGYLSIPQKEKYAPGFVHINIVQR